MTASMSEPDPTALDELRAFHRIVSDAASELHAHHAARLQCRRGCSDCCMDGLTVFRVEAQLIRDRHADLLRTAEPHPAGRCAFLDAEGACRIYEDRPYVCRTQGLPLRWIELRGDTAIELRDICPLNDGEDARPLEELAPEECWTLGEHWEARLRELQQAHDGTLERESLRGLFERS